MLSQREGQSGSRGTDIFHFSASASPQPRTRRSSGSLPLQPQFDQPHPYPVFQGSPPPTAAPAPAHPFPAVPSPACLPVPARGAAVSFSSDAPHPARSEVARQRSAPSCPARFSPPNFAAPVPRLCELGLGTSEWKAEPKAVLGALPPGSPAAPRLQVTVPAGAKAGGAFPARGTRRGACSSCVPPPSLLGTQAPSRAPRGPFPGTSEGSPRPRLGALHRRPWPTPRAPSRPGSGSHLSACPLLQQPPPDTPPPPVTAPSPAPAVFTRGGRGEAGRARGSANQRRWGGGEGREGGAATRFWCGRAAVCSRRGTSPWDWQAWPGTREGSAPRQSGVGGSAGNAGRFPEPRSARSLLSKLFS